MNRDDQEDEISRQMNRILSLTKDSAIDQAGMNQFDHCPTDQAAKPYPRILYEWNFIGKYICRVIESDPGIVHFEQARCSGDPQDAWEFERTDKPMGTANELIYLNERWMRSMDEIATLTRLLAEAEEAIRSIHKRAPRMMAFALGCSTYRRKEREP